MTRLLPDYRTYERPSPSPRRTQTRLYGDDRKKPGDVDLVYLHRSRREPTFLRSFRLVRVLARRELDSGYAHAAGT